MPSLHDRILIGAVAATCSIVATMWLNDANAQTAPSAAAYPIKPIRLVAPFAPGGNIGADLVAEAAPDGTPTEIAFDVQQTLSKALQAPGMRD